MVAVGTGLTVIGIVLLVTCAGDAHDELEVNLQLTTSPLKSEDDEKVVAVPDWLAFTYH